MAAPQLSEERPVYFYARPDPGQVPWNLTPADSLTFRSGPHHFEPAYGPPWLDVEVLKLDYDLIYFRAVTLSRDWVEVVVNGAEELPRSFPRTMWLDRRHVALELWPEFFLRVFSVEPIDAEANPLRSGPDASSANLGHSEGQDYRVLLVQEEWMLVESTDFREAGTPRGWIRWHDGERLLVTYNLLS